MLGYIYICAPELIRLQRCGWLDLVIVKYSTAVNHYTALNLTKLDILDSFATIEVATAYKVDGQVLDSFPAVPCRDRLYNTPRMAKTQHGSQSVLRPPQERAGICGVY